MNTNPNRSDDILDLPITASTFGFQEIHQWWMNKRHECSRFLLLAASLPFLLLIFSSPNNGVEYTWQKIGFSITTIFIYYGFSQLSFLVGSGLECLIFSLTNNDLSNRKSAKRLYFFGLSVWLLLSLLFWGISCLSWNDFTSMDF